METLMGSQNPEPSVPQTAYMFLAPCPPTPRGCHPGDTASGCVPSRSGPSETREPEGSWSPPPRLFLLDLHPPQPLLRPLAEQGP